MKNKFTSLALFIFVLISMNYAQTINVPADYLTIQAAIDAAAPGTTIQVAVGTYNEVLTVDEANLTIQGDSPTTTFITSTGVTPAIVISANNITLRNLGITNSTQLVEGVRVSGASTGLTVDHVNFTNLGNNPGPGNAYGIQIQNSFSSLNVSHSQFLATNLGAYSRAMGIFAPAGSVMNNFVVANCTFQNFFTGIDIRSEIDGLTASNNTFGPQEIPDCYAAAAGIYIGDGPDGNFDINNISVTNNLFTSFSRGVYIWNYATGESIKSINISNNTFTNSIYSSPIRLIARLDAYPLAAESKIEGPVTIDNNIFNQNEQIVNGAGVAMIDLRAGIESATSQIAITDNQITFNGPFTTSTWGILLRGPIANAEISGNTMHGNNAGGSSANMPATSAIVFQSNYSSFGPMSSNADINILDNRITGFVNGLAVYNSITNTYGDVPIGASIDINNNSINGNITGIYSGTGEVVDAENNWWGNATGPYNATTNPAGTGNAVTNNVDYSPWWGADYVGDTHSSAWTWYVNNSNSSTIQEGITAALAGDIINVAAGLYTETIIINKPLTLLGATHSINKNGYTVPASYNWDTNVESIINYPGNLVQSLSQAVDITSSNVVFKGFVVQILNAQADFNGDNLFRVNAGINRPDDAHMTLDNILVENNILGPTTNTTSQTGTSGRMGLYLASPTYPAHYQGITNTRIAGNKIFDALGNGNNVFVWGAAKNYNSLQNADYTGTVIEDNEISGSHRSGIEIAGGVSNLQINNNWIYDNSSENGGSADAALKYGNGIVIIRMGSDKALSDALGSENILIEENIFENNEKNAIYMGPFNRDHSIVNNNITNNGWNAIVVDLTEEYHGGTNPQYDQTSNLIANYNEISGNALFGVKVVGTPTNGFQFNATRNWWGNATGPYQATTNTGGLGNAVTSYVDYSPWWGANYVGDTHSSEWTWYTNDIIQDAIDAALAGDIINVNAGTYTENINVNKHLSVIGSLSGSDIATFMVPSTDNPVVRISASGLSTANPLLLKNISIHTSDTAPASDAGKMTGVRIVPAVSLSHIKLDNITVIGNNHTYPGLESGFDIAPDASVTDLVIVNSLFKDLSYGVISAAITSGNPGTLDDVTISFCEFDHNSSKGLYFERLSNALLSNLYVHDNGSDQALMASWAKPYGAGIDINLKYGSYSGIVLSALTVENNGLNAKEGMGIGIKARDDAPSYNSVPALLDDVLVTDCFIKGNERGIRAGEPNKNNASPTNLVITNSIIANNVKTYAGIDGSGYGELVNYSLASITAENNYWGTILESKIQTKIYNWTSVDFDPWQGKTVTPANAQTGVTVYLNQITWSAFGNGHYDFMLYKGGTMGGGGTQVGSTQNDLTTAYANIPNPLDLNTTYYWYVKAHFVTEWDEFSFTTASPSTAYLVTPADASTIYGTTIYFTWYSLVQGIVFDLQIDDDPTFGSPTTIASNTSATYFAYDGSSLMPGHTYKWRVISKNSGGSITGYSTIWSFIMPGMPTPTTLYPTSSMMIYTNPPTLYWYSGVYNPAYTYIVRYWKNGESTPTSTTSQTNLSGYFNIGSANIYTELTATLDAGATYHWEVATTDGSITSGWSNPTSSFVVYSSTPTTPPVPNLSWPVGGTTSYINPPTLYWYLGTYATGLQFYVEWDDDSNLDESPLGNSGWITNYYFAIPSSLSSGTIHWRVRSRIGSGGSPSAWSSVESFVIPSSSSSVPTPTTIYPIGGVTVYSLSQTLYWFAYSTSTLEYQVNVSEYPDVNGSGELNNSNTIYPGASSFTPNISYGLSGLTAGTTYYWQVRARIAGSAGTESAWSSVVSFTTFAGSFAVVPLIGSPNYGQPISNTSAVLSWIIPTQSESPLTYEVEFSKSKDMSNAVTVSSANKPFAEINGLDSKATYYWRVKSKTNNGSISSYSAIGSFKTDKAITAADEVEIPTEFSLLQNYPNPFNPTTRITYKLPQNSFVTLKIFDMLGREVRTLVNQEMNAGNISVDWNGENNYGIKVASGTYVYRINAGNFVSTKKMILIK